MNGWPLEKAFAPVPAIVREHIDEALTEVKSMNQKHTKPMMVLALTAMIVLALAGTAVAAGIRWGALDFFSAGVFDGEVLPEAGDALQTDIRQEGGMTDWAVFTLREALCDGYFTWLVFDVTPTAEETLLVTGMSVNAAANIYSPELPEHMALAQWAEENGYAHIVAVTVEQQKPARDKRFGQPRISWHREADGALSIMYQVPYDPEAREQTFTCSAMMGWEKDGSVRMPRSADLAVTLASGNEPLWTVEWQGEVMIPDSDIVVEEIRLVETVVGLYSEIICSAANLEGELPWLYLVNEQGRMLELSVGFTFNAQEGQSVSTGGTEKRDDGRYWSHGSYAAMAKPPEVVSVACKLFNKETSMRQLESVEIQLP